MKKIIVGLVLALVNMMILCACGVQSTSDMFELPEYIMHAGGSTSDGRMGTNSIEALDTSYENKNYWIELDFNQTSDGAWVCLHDWTAFYTKNLTGADVPDLETFEYYRKTTYGYESPTLEVLTEWLNEHPRAVIVTDVKDNNLAFMEYVSKNYPELVHRFVIQIYNRDEYTVATKCGFERIIYTLYRESPALRYDTDILQNFIEESDKLIALTYAGFKENAEGIFEVCKLGVPVYVHTINESDEQLFWKDIGAFGFYSDYVDNIAA